MSGFDNAVVRDRHVRWQLLTDDEQADLEANYPRSAGVVPGPGVFGNDVDPQFEAWLDSAYLARHSNDAIQNDPNF